MKMTAKSLGVRDAAEVIDQVWRECLDPDPVRSLRTKADRLEAEAREYRALSTACWRCKISASPTSPR